MLKELLACVFCKNKTKTFQGVNNQTQNLRIAQQSVRLALWLSLLKAVQFIPLEIGPTTINDLVERALGTPHILADAISYHTRIKLDLSSILTAQHETGVSFRDFISMTSCFTGQPPSPPTDDSDDPTSLLLLATYPHQDYFVHSLLLSGVSNDPSEQPVHLLHDYILFCDCLPPLQMIKELRFSETIISLPSKKYLSQLRSWLDAPCNNLGLHAKLDAMRLTLMALSNACVNSVAHSFLDVTELAEEMKTSLDRMEQLWKSLDTELPMDLFIGTLYLEGLYNLFHVGDISAGVLYFHNALSWLIKRYGDPRARTGTGSPGVVYLSWLLRLITRLTDEYALSCWYEETFRASRNFLPCCPIPLDAPMPTTSQWEGAKRLTPDQMIQIVRGTHTLLSSYALRWIVLSHPLVRMPETFSKIPSSDSGPGEGTTPPDSPNKHLPERLFGVNLMAPASILLSTALQSSPSRYRDRKSEKPYRKSRSEFLSSHIFGQIYSLGNNSKCCLGLGPPMMDSSDLSLCSTDVWWTSQPSAVTALKDVVIVAISAGARHSLALDSNGNVWGWGDAAVAGVGNLIIRKCQVDCSVCSFSWIGSRVSSKASHGKKSSNLKHLQNDQNRYIPVPKQVNIKPGMKLVSCGYDFSICASTTEVYSWGKNHFGQLGLGHFTDKTDPQLLSCFPPVNGIITHLSCGKDHAAAVLEDGSLWIWGAGTSGQLGMPLNQIRGGITQFQNASSLTSSRDDIIESPRSIGTGCVPAPKRLRILLIVSDTDPISDKRILELGAVPKSGVVTWRKCLAGDEYVVTISDDTQEEKFLPQIVQFLSVSCGHDHTMALDITNTIWVWGSCAHQKLGLPTQKWKAMFDDILVEIESENGRNCRSTPCQLSRESFGDSRIGAVFAGKTSSAAIDTENQLWQWGRLSDNDIESALQPKIQECFKNNKILMFSHGWAGDQFGVSDVNGAVALWGIERDGALGKCGHFRTWHEPPDTPLAVPAAPCSQLSRGCPVPRIVEVAIGVDFVILRTVTKEEGIALYENGGTRTDSRTMYSQQPSSQPQQQLRTVEWPAGQVRELLQNSLRTVGETNEIAQSAAEQLNCQTDQINRIHEESENISHNLESSQYLINGMKSWWGSVVQIFTSPPHRASLPPPPATNPLSTKLPLIPRSSNSSQINRQVVVASAPSVLEKEIDQDLDQLSGMLTELHSRALTIGDTISKHNEKLDTIHTTVERNSDRMDRQKRDIDKLLKR